MNTHIQYSSLFSTIYDEQQPVGNLGRGTHYSILRATTSVDELTRPTREVKIHDFALVWDEDHDTRVIEVIEKLCIQNALSPVRFIGERKGCVTILVDKSLYADKENLRVFTVIARSICDTLCDSWGCEIGYFDAENTAVTNQAGMLINAADTKVYTYLENINNLWGLGIKPYKFN
ncbi:TPA: hypothetical protein I7701_21795 [Vibrio vulnificus]|nr:hypothetical protein [Vibrio vulnificus]HAS8389347.1 hypothetical protein [Vibrio vulnificus]